MLRTIGGRPGLRRLLVSYFRAASLRCQASSVAGVIGKTSAQRLRGMNRRERGEPGPVGQTGDLEQHLVSQPSSH